MRRRRRELHSVERAHRATRCLRKRLEPFVRLTLVGATRAEQRTRAWAALRVQRALKPDREDVKLRASRLLGAFVDDDAIRERQPLIRYERRLGRVVVQLECSLCIAREDEEAPVPARRARAQPRRGVRLVPVQPAARLLDLLRHARERRLEFDDTRAQRALRGQGACAVSERRRLHRGRGSGARRRSHVPQLKLVHDGDVFGLSVGGCSAAPTGPARPFGVVNDQVRGRPLGRSVAARALLIVGV